MSTKIYQKVHVFWECDLGGVLIGFGEGFWEAKSLDFLIFFDSFPKQILKRVSNSKKVDENCDLDGESGKFGSGR